MSQIAQPSLKCRPSDTNKQFPKVKNVITYMMYNTVLVIFSDTIYLMARKTYSKKVVMKIYIIYIYCIYICYEENLS